MAEIVVYLFEAVHVQHKERFCRAGDGQRGVNQLPGVSFVVKSRQGVPLRFLSERFLVAVLGVRVAEQEDGVPRPFALKVNDETHMEPLFLPPRIRQPVLDDDLMGGVGVFVVRRL